MRPPTHYARWIFLSSLCGVLAGAAATIFLGTLEWTTQFHARHPDLVWALPLGGFAVGWLYHRHGREVTGGSNLILDEIHDPKKVIPFRMTPLVLLGTIVTHLFGGPVGREGTAVQMSASLSDQLTRFFRIKNEERSMLLMAGMGAGFSAAIGTPWAGALFGMEVLHVGRFKVHAWLECFVASFVGFFTAHHLHASHSPFPPVEIPACDARALAYVAAAGLAFGLAGRLFAASTHAVEHAANRWLSYPPLRPLVGGVLLVALFALPGTFRYQGLGIPIIHEALQHVVSFKDPALKMLFSSLAVGTGFKGGEFVPLVFVGATLGSALSVILPVSFALLAAVGFAATFGAAANTPIACTLMAIEIFGVQIAPFALVACLVSYLCSGRHGIYKAQRRRRKESHNASVACDEDARPGQSRQRDVKFLPGELLRPHRPQRSRKVDLP